MKSNINRLGTFNKLQKTELQVRYFGRPDSKADVFQRERLQCLQSTLKWFNQFQLKAPPISSDRCQKRCVMKRPVLA